MSVWGWDWRAWPGGSVGHQEHKAPLTVPSTLVPMQLIVKRQ